MIHEDLAWRRVSLIVCSDQSKAPYRDKVRGGFCFRPRVGEWVTHYNIFEQEIGVVVPCEPHLKPPKPDGVRIRETVVVVPVEYFHHGTWRKVPPGSCYYLIDMRDLKVTGTCYDDERAHVERACELLGIVPYEDKKRTLKSLRERRDQLGLDREMEELDRIDRERSIRRNYRRPK